MSRFRCFVPPRLAPYPLGANGMLDNLIKEGLKQSDCIKISFQKGAKEITGHVAPDQAWFGTEYFLACMLPDFKSKILTQLLADQKNDGPLLLSLMGQRFQDAGLTKWTSVIAKQCPDNADCTKVNFDKCIRDYLEAITRFPIVGNQLIRWLCTAKKTALILINKFMQHWVQNLTYLKGGYLRQQWKYPWRKRRVNTSSLRIPRHINSSFWTWTSWCSLTCSSSSLFFQVVSCNRQSAWSSWEDCQG